MPEPITLTLLAAGAVKLFFGAKVVTAILASIAGDQILEALADTVISNFGEAALAELGTEGLNRLAEAGITTVAEIADAIGRAGPRFG